VANTSNPGSISKAARWKEQFDAMTKVEDEPSIPCTLFINHDSQVEDLQELPTFSLRGPTQQLSKQWLSHSAVRVNYQKMTEFEALAQTEKNGYFGIYHISISQPETIYESFENFVSRMMEDQEFAQRTFTVGSTFFDEYTIKSTNKK
jgi:hypothetical protein